jgi:ribokinase
VIKIAVLASFNMDLVMRAQRLPTPGETLQGDFAMYLGGKGFNQAIAARRLGAEVAVVGRVGDDQFGAAFLAALDREGIDREGVTVDPHDGTGVASIVVDADGENAILQAPRANRNLTAVDVDRATAAFDGVDIALFQLELSEQGELAFARRARSLGATVIFNPAPAAPVAGDLLALCDIIVPNQIEACALTGVDARTVDGAFAAADALRRRGPSVCIVTMGASGALCVSGDCRLQVPAFGVPVVDTVGAGDAFCAALAVRYAEGAELTDALRFAAAAGAIACTRQGAEPSMPRRTDVEELLAKGAER